MHSIYIYDISTLRVKVLFSRTVPVLVSCWYWNALSVVTERLNILNFFLACKRFHMQAFLGICKKKIFLGVHPWKIVGNPKTQKSLYITNICTQVPLQTSLRKASHSNWHSSVCCILSVYTVWCYFLFNVHGSGHRKNILIYIQQDATLHSLFYLETALHVSGGTSAHHQECKQLYLQHLVFLIPLLLSASIAAGSSNGVTVLLCFIFSKYIAVLMFFGSMDVNIAKVTRLKTKFQCGYKHSDP
jgi:hypothetical protein